MQICLLLYANERRRCSVKYAVAAAPSRFLRLVHVSASDKLVSCRLSMLCAPRRLAHCESAEMIFRCSGAHNNNSHTYQYNDHLISITRTMQPLWRKMARDNKSSVKFIYNARCWRRERCTPPGDCICWLILISSSSSPHCSRDVAST